MVSSCIHFKDEKTKAKGNWLNISGLYQEYVAKPVLEGQVQSPCMLPPPHPAALLQKMQVKSPRAGAVKVIKWSWRKDCSGRTEIKFKIKYEL